MTYARGSLAVLFVLLAACGSSHSDDDGGTDAGAEIICFGCSDSGFMPDLPPPRDFGPDLDLDAGWTACFIGRACDPTVGCNGSAMCQGEVSTNVTYDTVDGGTGTIPVVYFEHGTCTNAPFGTPASMVGRPGACDPTMASDDPAMAGRDHCDACSRCVKLQDAMGTTPEIAICLQRCTPSATDAGGCRTGYTCDPASHACTPAQCETDTQCRLYRVDTNGNGMADMGDHFVLDPLSTATCDMATGRCTGTGTPAGHTGDACTMSSMCASGGVCLTEFEAHQPGGYCTRLYCDLPGGGCDSGASCRDFGGGLHVCTSTCTVGAEPASAVLGPGGHGDTCRAGYSCLYDESRPAGATNNGSCIGGNYNAVATENVGHACTMDSDCWSPHGLGKCINDHMEHTCTVIECGGFADPDAVCGTGNHCEVLMGFSLCMHLCSTPADCAGIGGDPGLACVPLRMGGPSECWPACTSDAQCQTGHTCVGASLSSTGKCV